MYEHLLEPLKFYEKLGKQQHSDNIREHFDALKKASGINEEENRATVKKYKHELVLLGNVKKKISRYKLFKVLLIIAAVLGGIFAIVGMIEPNLVYVGVGVAVIPLSIILIIKKIKPLMKDAEKIREKHEAAAAELLALAESQMAPLNALFRDDDTFRLIEKTIPDIKFTERFTPRLKTFLKKDVARETLNNNEASVVCAVSGEFSSNPFVFLRRLVHRLGVETYHGTLVIHWTESYTDSEGRRRTRTRTQTLHASLTKPKPFYHLETFLCYANQAAPDLCFSRAATDTEELNDKQIERRVKKGKKKLEKKAREALEDGKDFREMSNAEFDVLFGATDRDHEVQFRLMFTPLAQKNMISLLKKNEGYGDDFSFTKKKELNLIKSEHAQSFAIYPLARNYYSYDVDVAKANFESFNNNYFKSVFFDFAPLLSIPAYLDEPTGFLEDDENKNAQNFSYVEHEKKANELGASHFAHEMSKTSVILKTRCVNNNDKHDDVEVVAYSYATANRVDFVSVLGGDGRFHPVPVHWVEYLPLENARIMRMANDGTANIL